MAQHRIFSGHCLHVLRSLRDESFHSVVTDPPYELGFMGKDWDNAQIAFNPRVWQHCYRVLKPGGYLLAFGGTRTFHRLACAIEDAGFEIRDSIAWLSGSGFPKSLDVSKAIDKANGRAGERVLELKRELRKAVDASGLRHAEIDVRCGFRATNYLTMPAEGKRFDPWVGILPTADKWRIMANILECHDLDGLFDSAEREITQHATRNAVPGDTITFDQRGSAERERRDIPATDAAKKWAGWGTALKPAFEPIIVARKPIQGTVAANVLEHGTGALNIDACRVGSDIRINAPAGTPGGNGVRLSGGDGRDAENARRYAEASKQREPTTATGRWPTNVVLDGEMATELDEQSDGAGRYFPIFKRSKDDSCGDESIRAESMSAGKSLESNGGSSRTAGRGSNITGPSLMDMKSTTGITTSSTTTSKTLYASPKSGMTTTTHDYANSTDGSAVSNSDSASDVASGNQPARSPCDEQEPTRDTARNALKRIGANGLPKTESHSTLGDAPNEQPDSTGSFPVFKYQAKAPAKERPKVDGVSHPTVKPLELMRWLTKLVTPPRGRILDPFAGSGTTVEAAILEGFRPTAIELCDGTNGKPDYVAMIEKRAARAYRKVADGSVEK